MRNIIVSMLFVIMILFLIASVVATVKDYVCPDEVDSKQSISTSEDTSVESQEETTEVAESEEDEYGKPRNKKPRRLFPRLRRR